MVRYVSRKPVARAGSELVFPVLLLALSTLSLLAPGPLHASGEAVPLNTFDLPPGASVTITFEVDVDSPLGTCADAVANQGTVTGDNFGDVLTDDPDGGGMTDPTTTPLDAVALSLTKTNGTTFSIPGGTTTYTITVSNAGPSVAVGATVTDTFPAALSGVNWSCIAAGAGSSCSPSGSGNISQVVNVGVGGTVTFTATGTIDPGATGSLVNTASVVAAGNQLECATGDNSQTDTDLYAAEGDLAATKTNGTTEVTAGGPTTYTITVTNSGPSTAFGATVQDFFPPELTGVNWACVASPGSTCSASGSGNIDDTVTIAPSGTLTYTATATVDPDATGFVDNTATVIAPDGFIDTDEGANNSQTDSDAVTRVADLAITKDDDADPPAPGANLTYTITVENLGPSSANNVVVTDNLPAGVTLVATSGCAEDPNAAPTCTLGALAPGAMASYTIEVSIDTPPPSSISNTATVAGDETDPVAGNDSDTETTTLDNLSPEVALLDSSQTTGDGEITQCETVLNPLTQFLVTFSEAVQDNGPADPDSVTNPANFRLVSPGSPGADFDTVSCAGGTGGDTVIPIDTVSYDDVNFIATLDVNGGAPVPPGLYRFLACGTTTILDLAGNPLDGGGGAGTDFVRTFRADPGNSLDDAHFDNHSPECSLGVWTSTDPAQVEVAAEDVDASPLSGSAHNANPLNGFDLAQCVDLAGQQQVPLSAAVRVAADPGAVVSVTLLCDFLDAPLCAGTSVGSAVVPGAFLDTGGGWLTLEDVVQSAPGTASAVCGFAVLPPVSGGYDAFLDSLFLGGNELIFLDGFETGDTSQWSGSQP